MTLWHGHALDVARELADGSADCIVTSPPYYGLRDYGVEGQWGLEETPGEYVENLRGLFSELRRVLAADGTLWLNLGDSYARGNTGQGNAGPSSNLQGGTRPSFREDGANGVPRRRIGGMERKNLLGIPWRVAFALQDDGWILRNAIVWHKPNAMPSSVKDRLSNRYEHVFLFSRSARYWFNLDPIKVPTTGQAAGNTAGASEAYGQQTGTANGGRRFGGNASSTLTDVHETRNPGDVWSITTQPFPEAHFACMSREVAERAVQAGCKPGGRVLDLFHGSGTTAQAAEHFGHPYTGGDLRRDYLEMSLRTRLAQPSLLAGGGQ